MTSAAGPDGPKQTSVFAWGCHRNGQLGLGGIEEEQVLTPRELTAFRDRQIKRVACGQEHTVFVMEDGTLYCCGNNDKGQLGHNKPVKKPEQVDVLETQVIRYAACGQAYSVAITNSGQLFSWGDHSLGQLGCGPLDSTQRQTPKLVKRLSKMCIIQVSCGYGHMIALTDDGSLYSWGDNRCGQLGLGVKDQSVDTPGQLKCLTGLAVAQVAAGGSHSFVLTVSGALFGWGQNRFGQLGLGDNKDRDMPTHCKSLRTQRVKHIVCGEDHTAALTADGGVFTFGSGMYGQLGHNSTDPEYLPKKVFELMGSVVSQLSCGRGHTVAYVPSNGRMYSFGQGGNGQLGSGNSVNRPSPCTVKGPFVSFHKPGSETLDFSLEKETPLVVRQIYSGGDQSFVSVTRPETNTQPADMRITDPSRRILSLDENMLRDFAMVPPMHRLQPEMSEKIEKTFSAQCLNGSFLLNEDHYGASRKKPGVDIEAAADCFSRLAKLPNPSIGVRIASALERNLLPGLPKSPPDIEAMRLYLTLPFCDLFAHSKNFLTLTCPFGKAVAELEAIPGKILDSWWGQAPKEYFQRLVSIYKEVVIYVIQLPTPRNEVEQVKRNSSLTDCLRMLKKLNSINEQNGQIIPYDNFYIPELREKLDLKVQYISWVQQQVSPQRLNSTALSFCTYPFLFDALAKTELLQIDAMLQMQFAVDEVARRNIRSLFQPTIDPVSPCLVLYIHRNNLVQETINQLTKYRNHDFKKPLKVAFVGEEALDGGGVRKVVFMGEEAVDDGGVRKEFFLLLLRDIMDPKYGMFRHHEESRLLWFNEQTFEDQTMFCLIGILCGLAIYNATIVDISFPLALYKKLLGRTITLDDLKELEPSVGRSLQHVLDYEGDDLETTFCLTFEVTREAFGEIRHIELKPGGSAIAVNKDNRQEYVDAYIDFTFNRSIKDQYEAFSEGFLRVCGGKVLELFHPQELQAMVVGNENYDWEEMEKNTEYKGEYHRRHQTIVMFWEIFRAMSHEYKKKFLAFLTGCDRIPIYGMKAVKMIIQPTKGGGDYLPVAHTCFNLLDLPIYTDKDMLRSKLAMAVQHAEGFGLV